MVCTCRNGFFRADTDPADSACTSESCSGQGGEAREAVEVMGVCVWHGGMCCAHARCELDMKTPTPAPHISLQVSPQPPAMSSPT